MKIEIEIEIIFLPKKGYMQYPKDKNYPKAKFIKPGDTLRINLDLKIMQAKMNINDIDYGVVPNFKPKQQNYRLGVSVYAKECGIEFI